MTILAKEVAIMSNKKSIYRIQEYAKQLSLANLADDDLLLIQYSSQQLLCLEQVLQNEIEQRKAKSIERRCKQSHLPEIKTLDSFNTAFNENITKDMLYKLGTLEWLIGNYNVVLVGNAGTGKSHIAIALGYRAIEGGYKVSYVTFYELIVMLKSQQHIRQHSQQLRHIQECQLLIIDELGYIEVSKEDASLFYQFISSINNKMSIVLTTNLEFAYWGQLLGDEVLATAIVDRLTYKCQIISTAGKSYRLSHHMDAYNISDDK